MPLPDSKRRRLLAGAACLPLLLTATRAWAEPDAPRAAARQRFLQRLQAVERAAGGRLGVSVRQPGDDALLHHRGHERFLMCSTFKLALAACVLERVDRGREQLGRAIAVPRELVSHSPLTGPHAGATMTIGELCAATVTVSDNTAANLLLRALGGPAGLTAFLRASGDPITRLDRFETELNLPAPGKDWDSTTPVAMTALLARLLFGTVLSAPSRTQLQAWTTQASTGMERLRAAIPADWPQGDKTGTGPTHTNDVAWFTPPGGQPWLVAVYYAGGKGDGKAQSAVVAEVGRAVIEHLVHAR